MIKVISYEYEDKQRHETKEKRRLNKMDQWWLGTAPSGLELAGEADSPAPAKVYIL